MVIILVHFSLLQFTGSGVLAIPLLRFVRVRGLIRGLEELKWLRE